MVGCKGDARLSGATCWLEERVVVRNGNDRCKSATGGDCRYELSKDVTRAGLGEATSGGVVFVGRLAGPRSPRSCLPANSLPRPLIGRVTRHRGVVVAWPASMLHFQLNITTGLLLLYIRYYKPAYTSCSSNLSPLPFASRVSPLAPSPPLSRGVQRAARVPLPEDAGE